MAHQQTLDRRASTLDRRTPTSSLRQRCESLGPDWTCEFPPAGTIPACLGSEPRVGRPNWATETRPLRSLDRCYAAAFESPFDRRQSRIPSARPHFPASNWKQTLQTDRGKTNRFRVEKCSDTFQPDPADATRIQAATVDRRRSTELVPFRGTCESLPTLSARDDSRRR